MFTNVIGGTYQLIFPVLFYLGFISYTATTKHELTKKKEKDEKYLGKLIRKTTDKRCLLAKLLDFASKKRILQARNSRV